MSTTTYMLNSKFNNRVVSLGNQTSKVLDIIKLDGSITRMTAMHYSIANITARIADLRNAGIPVLCEEKRDARGNRYGRWTIPSSIELTLVA